MVSFRGSHSVHIFYIRNAMIVRTNPSYFPLLIPVTANNFETSLLFCWEDSNCPPHIHKGYVIHTLTSFSWQTPLIVTQSSQSQPRAYRCFFSKCCTQSAVREGHSYTLVILSRTSSLQTTLFVIQSPQSHFD